MGRPTICLCFAIALLCLPAWAQSSGRKTSALALDSSDTRLVKAFDWAKQQALAYVFEGDPVGPWYEAALPGRASFCMRDVSHQSMGAHALGLSLHTRNMLRRFAENISDSKDWCTYWEIDRLNHPTAVDYRNDGDFWYCLPANFDVLDSAYRMYLWTGDPDYVSDPVFLNFYNRTVHDYVARWQLDLEHVMTRPPRMNLKAERDPASRFERARGIPTYDESRGPFTVGVDLLATQYAAYRAYAFMQAVRGDTGAAQKFYAEAARVKALVNDKWWDAKTQRFYAALDRNHQFQGHAGADLLYRDVTEGGPKTQGALNDLLDRIRNQTGGIEAQSYQPEILYRYGAPDVAYAQIMDLTREGKRRREYPEVSYAVIGAIVTGLIGVTVEASPQASSLNGVPEIAVRTYPGLTTETWWAELRHLPVRDNEITVRQVATRETTLTNLHGPVLTWKAMFPGTFESLLVDGKLVKAHTEQLPMGHSGSWVTVTVRTGKTAKVEAPGTPEQ